MTHSAFLIVLLQMSWIVAHAQVLDFQPKLLCIDNNEACDLGDIDRDGDIDVVAGRNWYAAPEFVPRPVRAIPIHPPDYARNNGEHLYDVNTDGWLDVVTTGWGETRILWYENPGEVGLSKGLPWAVHVLAEVGHGDGEIGSMHDIDQDGVPEYIINSYVKSNPFTIFRFNKENPLEMLRHDIGSKNSHGVGFGDVNGDGRTDILFDEGWYEQPSVNIWSKPWTCHHDWQRAGGSCPMQVVDLTGDGLPDIIWGRGHDYGLYWYEQLSPMGDSTRWKTHLIDSSWSQAHVLQWTDIDADGKSELIAGKRIYAHSGKDPGSDDRPHIYYYDWVAVQQKFNRSPVVSGKIGTGLFIRNADLNTDGRIDLVVAGKTGTYILFNAQQQGEK